MKWVLRGSRHNHCLRSWVVDLCWAKTPFVVATISVCTAINKKYWLVNKSYDRIFSCPSKFSMPLNLSIPMHETKKKTYLRFTCKLPGLVKATERLCAKDPRKINLGKTNMVVDLLLWDPPKLERKASCSTFSFSN